MKIFEITKTSEYSVALDMDGVVADFSSMVKEISGFEPEELEKDKLWNMVNGYTKRVEPFFENLPVINDAFDLVRFIDKHFDEYFFLTATGPNKNVAQQKRNWIAKVFTPVIPIITVERSIHKAKYAKPNRILIDDREQSVVPWVDAGGIGILHENTHNTISKLKDIIGI